MNPWNWQLSSLPAVLIVAFILLSNEIFELAKCDEETSPLENVGAGAAQEGPEKIPGSAALAAPGAKSRAFFNFPAVQSQGSQLGYENPGERIGKTFGKVASNVASLFPFPGLAIVPAQTQTQTGDVGKIEGVNYRKASRVAKVDPEVEKIQKRDGNLEEEAENDAAESAVKSAVYSRVRNPPQSSAKNTKGKKFKGGSQSGFVHQGRVRKLGRLAEAQEEKEKDE